MNQPRRDELVLAGSRDHLVRLGLLYVEQRLAWLARQEALRSATEQTAQRQPQELECAR